MKRKYILGVTKNILGDVESFWPDKFHTKEVFRQIGESNDILSRNMALHIIRYGYNYQYTSSIHYLYSYVTLPLF